MKSYLHLPCLRGIIGDWTFFCSVMKVKDIVERVITVSQSEELYSKKMNEILQREIDKKRVDKICNYLLNNNEHFFGSIIVAIYGGNPIWSDFDIESHFLVENKELNNEESDFIQNKLGVLSLSGEEIIFALDGQHRVKGFQEAYVKNPEIGEEEVSLIFVVHNQTNKERTRRLFTVLNKYAQKPKEAELIILDEDDSASIITRRLIENHSILKLPNVLSSSNSSNIPSTDMHSFTTLVMVNRINKLILANFSIDYTKRPSEDEINRYYRVCSDFWDYFFMQFPQITIFIDGGESSFTNGNLYNRNNETGGSLLLRPVGQKLFAQIYCAFKAKGKLDELTTKIPLVDFNLNGNYCKYVTWYNKILPKSETLQRRVYFYALGLSSDSTLHDDLRKVYENFGASYTNKIEVV